MTKKNGVVTITHYAGDALKDGTYSVIVDETDRTKEFKNAGADDGYFGTGDMLSRPISSGSLRHVAIGYKGEEGSFMLAEKWFEGIAGNGGWNSSSQRISVRNPGAKAMEWVKIQQKTSDDKIPLQSFHYSAEKDSDKSNQPEWGLQVCGRNTFELKGRTIRSGSNNYIIKTNLFQK